MSNKKFVDPLEDDPFEFPLALLKQVAECAPHGFIFFFVDDTGTPQVRASFDNQIAEMGLRSFATSFLKGINTAQESGIEQTLHEEDDSEDDF